ncbi:MAG: hypothetical protein AAGG51_25940 [Cyanobacteria bacterium P01_G01_bin.54]
MPPSDTFRDRLRAGQLQDAFLLAMGQAVELNVTTWVAAQADIAAATQGHRLQTHIDLVQGDIENEIGERFITQTDYQPLRQFHLQQVAESQRIIRQNLQSLQKLFSVLADVQTRQQEPGEWPSFSDAGAVSTPTESFTSPPPSPLDSGQESWHSTPTSATPAFAAEESVWDAAEQPWPAEPADPFADLPLDELPLNDLQIADLQSLTPGASMSEQEPEWGSDSSATPDAGWRFSDLASSPSPTAPLDWRSPQSGQAPLEPPPSLEDDEDWDEFVEFVEESSFEAETIEPSFTNPFALPLEDNPQPYTSVIQEDWSAVPPPPDEPLDIDSTPQPREDDSDPLGEDIFGSQP